MFRYVFNISKHLFTFLRVDKPKRVLAFICDYGVISMIDDNA